MSETVSVITLSKDRPDLVERLSDALDAQAAPLVDAPNVGRVLVNNGAPRKRRGYDPTTKLASNRGWLVIEPGYNTSFSEGNNLAAEAARAEWLWLLNNDAQPTTECLSELWAARGDVTGCLISHVDGSVNHAGVGLAPWPHHLARGNSIASVRGAYSEPAPRVPAVTFASVLIRRTVWDALGGLDPVYWYCYEDTDFCCRAIEAGYVINLALGALVSHDECGTRERGGAYEQQGADEFRMRWGSKLLALQGRALGHAYQGANREA